MKIGEIIKNKRLELGFTLEEVGNACGVGKSTVRKWETGMIVNIGVDKIKLLAAKLEIDPLTFVRYGEIEQESQRPAPDLSKEEAQLLAYYRSMNRAGRTVLMAAAEGFASSSIYQADNPGDAAVSS